MQTQTAFELPVHDGFIRGSLWFNDHIGNSVVIYVHGLGGHRGGGKSTALRNECELREWSFLEFDFRSHGESTGSTRDLTGTRLIEDLLAVQTYLRSHGVKQLFLVGSSMGGWASSWFPLLGGDLVRRCVFLAPAFRFLSRRWDFLSKEAQDKWRTTGIHRLQNEWIDIELGYPLVSERERYEPEELARKWHRPALIFHGLLDDVVSYRDSIDFVTQSTAPLLELRLLKQGDHRMEPFKHEIAAEACRWFAPDWKS